MNAKLIPRNSYVSQSVSQTVLFIVNNNYHQLLRNIILSTAGSLLTSICPAQPNWKYTPSCLSNMKNQLFQNCPTRDDNAGCIILTNS